MTENFTANPPLPLSSSYNTRELGGYPARGGKLTQKRRLLRSDSLAALSAEDTQFLYDYGLRTVIDLRSPEECAKHASAFAESDTVRYLNLPLFDNLRPDAMQSAIPSCLSEIYIDLLDNGQQALVVVLRAILTAPAEQCLLFNCTAGKDRTGLIAMLLLLNAGVAEEQVVADYAESAINLRPLADYQRQQLAAMGLVVPDYAFTSDAEQMLLTLAHLHEKYSDVTTYLRVIGLSGVEIDGLARRLLG